MYLFLTFTILLFLTILSYNMFNREILSPIFLTCLLFLFVSSIALVNYDIWKVRYHGLFFISIIGSIVFMILGELIGRSLVFSSVINRKHDRNNLFLHKTNFVIGDISRVKTTLLIVFCMIINIWAIQEFLTNATLAGYSGENLFNYARIAQINIDIQTNYILVISKYAVMGLGYYALFKVIPLLSNGRLWRLNTNKYFYVASILSLLLQEILSTGRVGFIRFFQITLFLIVLSRRFLIQEKIKFFGKFLKYVIVLGALFFSIFFLLGFLRNPEFFSEGWKSFSIYFASPFPALNEWLRSYEVSSSFGLESFKALRNLLVRFGVNVKEPQYFQSSISFPNGDRTNIYSALMHYIKDFNIAGCFIIYFIQGLFFSTFFYLVLNRRKYDLWVLIFSYYAYDLVRQITAAGFLASYLGVTHSFVLLFIIISYLFLNPKQTYSVSTITIII